MTCRCETARVLSPAVASAPRLRFFFFSNALVALPTAGELTAHVSLYEPAAGLLPRTASAEGPDLTLSFSPE